MSIRKTKELKIGDVVYSLNGGYFPYESIAAIEEKHPNMKNNQLIFIGVIVDFSEDRKSYVVNNQIDSLSGLAVMEISVLKKIESNVLKYASKEKEGA